MQGGLEWYHRGSAQSITRRDCWQKGGPERGGGRFMGSSLLIFGAHLKEWSSS